MMEDQNEPERVPKPRAPRPKAPRPKAPEEEEEFSEAVSNLWTIATRPLKVMIRSYMKEGHGIVERAKRVADSVLGDIEEGEKRTKGKK